MDNTHGVLVGKIVDFTREELEQVDIPPLSQESRAFIAQSGVESLQSLLGPDFQEVGRALVLKYWRK
jgi:hypothetical protein